MRNFLISSIVDIIIIFASYYLFRTIISGPTRHRLYEKYISSFAKFVIYLFLVSVILTTLIVFILYRTRYTGYINIAAPAVLSIVVGFVISTVPTRGTGDDKKANKEQNPQK